jgi:hypothetical protein
MKNQHSYRDSGDMEYIAEFKNTQDSNSYYYYHEILFRATDGTFMCKRIGNPGYYQLQNPDGEEDHQKIWIPVKSPEYWLIHRGHLRLAAYLFPDMKQYVELQIREMGIRNDFGAGESFYMPGGAKGESVGGK